MFRIIKIFKAATTEDCLGHSIPASLYSTEKEGSPREARLPRLHPLKPVLKSGPPGCFHVPWTSCSPSSHRLCSTHPLCPTKNTMKSCSDLQLSPYPVCPSVLLGRKTMSKQKPNSQRSRLGPAPGAASAPSGILPFPQLDQTQASAAHGPPPRAVATESRVAS